MSLPLFNTSLQELALLQSRWKSLIDPVLARPSNGASILKNVSLASGANTINHLLGRKLVGWKIIRQRASASIWDSQDANNTPALTLILNASAPVVVDLEVL